ncbi:MAG: S9 family peptidase [Fluviicola sp.]|nr:S9 family peptidase [Fluviicola sp.]
MTVKIISLILLLGTQFIALSQNVMTAETLIQLNRISPIGLTSDGASVIYRVSKVDIPTNSKSTKLYILPLENGTPKEIKDYTDFITNRPEFSKNGKYKLLSKEVKLKKVSGSDFYPELTESNVMIYDELNYRHWDKWENGNYNHVFIENLATSEQTDIMQNEKYHCPQKPFGGSEDYIWNSDGSKVLYVSKKKEGTEYAISTNTDIYEYDIATATTKNLTEENKGYDTHPAFSKDGQLAWLQMNRDGYESDKNDICILIDGQKVNLTKFWDGTVNEFTWYSPENLIYFIAPVDGTVQLFSVNVPKKANGKTKVRQITKGQFDVHGIIGQSKGKMVVKLRDMNHATELYIVDLKSGSMSQLSHVNDGIYNSLLLSKVESRMIPTTDGKEMLSWVIYPPNFDPNKKYPTLLYCQGGPQGALSQFYSYRWNFQLMAANGYIVIAPNRRGMPGWGVEWNEQISKDYGGQNMQDYLSAIDDISKESYVDKERLGCIGASYGGYSAFYLAGIHENRFKTFIAHDGIFNWKSMYGTTEELFFVNWDLGGAPWEKANEVAQRSHNDFNPAEHVENWNTPILIIQGGKDYRVPIGQGLEAFQAAQLQGIKSKLLYFPEENHWVLGNQNSLIWHEEFRKWLEETLK